MLENKKVLNARGNGDVHHAEHCCDHDTLDTCVTKENKRGKKPAEHVVHNNDNGVEGNWLIADRGDHEANHLIDDIILRMMHITTINKNTNSNQEK